MASWLNIYQTPIEPSADAIENAANRQNFLLHLKHYLITTFVKENKSELKIWFLEALGNLQLDSRKKSKKIRSIFYERENRNIDFERSILKQIIAENPKEIAKLLRSDFRIFKKYFQTGNSEARIKKWFDWFSYERSDTKYGAVALQGFAFKNRNDVWDRFLVWNSKRSVTPVIAVVQPWLMMQIDVVGTIKNLLDDPREEFWTSLEVDESLSSGQFLSVLEVDYFIDELLKILNGDRTEDLRRELNSLIDRWMSEFSFDSVCKNCFHSLNEEQLFQIVKDILSPIDSPMILHAYICQLGTFEEFLLYNALTDDYRSQFIKNLMQDESKPIRINIDHLITSIISIGTEEQRKMDEISHWALRKRLKNERVAAHLTYLSLIEFECILLETFLINYRLASNAPNQIDLEHVMHRAGLHFEAVKEESFKKRRKHKNKHQDKDNINNNSNNNNNTDEELKIKRVFIGWRIQEFQQFENANIKPNSNESNIIISGTSTDDSKKRKHDEIGDVHPLSSRVIYAIKELPYLLSRLYLYLILQWTLNK